MMAAGGAAGGGLSSALASGMFSLAGSGLQAWSQSREAEKQRDWAEYMASTAYQRTMADMEAAGLNPILAYSQGATGSGPGAAATSMPNVMEGLAASAMEAKMLEANIAETESRESKNYAEGQRAREQTKGQQLINKILDADATDAQFKKRFYYGGESGGAGEWMKRFRMLMDSLQGGRSQ